MGDRKRSENDAKTAARRRETIREESAVARHDGAQFPSSDDLEGGRGERTASDAVPGKDEIASDASTPPDDLHGSLHGRWTKTDEPKT